MKHAFAWFLALTSPAAAQTLDATVQMAFQPHVEARDITGAAVAVVQGAETHFFYFGSMALGSQTPPGPHTLFEIGSITKVMTGTLLALAIGDESVTLDTTLGALLPEGLATPSFKGREITLRDLATHTSALPRMPGNWKPANVMQPYVDYTEDKLYAFLNDYKLPSAPGTTYDYSNYATALLGHVLAKRAGTSYEKLLRERLLAPLGMAETHIASTPDQLAVAAQGSTTVRSLVLRKNLEPRAMWDFDVFQPAGAVRSNIEDMAKFLRASMSPPDSPLGRAMRLAQQPQFKVNDQLSVGLNWHILSLPKKPVITWHNGQTGGYHSFLGFDPKSMTGIVVLCNTDFDIDSVALGLLETLGRESK